MSSRFLLASALTVLLATPADGAQMVLTLDPQSTEITFQLGATLHTVEGTFQLASGEIRFDPAGGPAAGRIEVDVTSGDTGNEGRDEDMHAAVLESDRFPKAVFLPQAVEGTLPRGDGSAELTVRGSLQVHGDEHPVVLPVEVSVQGDRATARITFPIPYVEWGMKDPSKFLLRVDKHVDVTVEAEGTLAPAGGEP